MVYDTYQSLRHSSYLLVSLLSQIFPHRIPILTQISFADDIFHQHFLLHVQTVANLLPDGINTYLGVMLQIECIALARYTFDTALVLLHKAV